MSVRRFTSLSLLSALSRLCLYLTDYHRDIRNTFSYTFPEQFFLVLVNGHPEYLHSATGLKESATILYFIKKIRNLQGKIFYSLINYRYINNYSLNSYFSPERERGSIHVEHISFCHILIFYDYFKVVIMQIFIENKNMTHVHGISILTHVV